MVLKDSGGLVKLYAAVNVAHDEIAVLIGSAHRFCVSSGHCLRIKHMGMSRPVEPPDAGQPRVVAVFIHVGGIQRISGLMIVQGKFPGQHHAQLRRVLTAAHSRFRVVVQLLVDDGYAAGLRARAAAAANEYINLGRIDSLFLQHVQDHLIPKRHLPIDMGKLQQHRRVMELAFLEQLFFIFKQADFGRG